MLTNLLLVLELTGIAILSAIIFLDLAAAEKRRKLLVRIPVKITRRIR